MCDYIEECVIRRELRSNNNILLLSIEECVIRRELRSNNNILLLSIEESHVEESCARVSVWMHVCLYMAYGFSISVARVSVRIFVCVCKSGGS